MKGVMLMADKFAFRLDSDAINAMLRENFMGVVEAKAAEVAANARGMVNPKMPVASRGEINKSGRPVGLVTIMHAGGLNAQAKHGALTKAATQAGLDLKRYGGGK